MAGRENWRGSGFHADVVIERVLVGLTAIRNAAHAGTAPPILPDYWIEHAVRDEGPDWDVVERQGTKRILEELKSGKISAEERRTMWVRVRRSRAAGVTIDDVAVRLTADRDRVTLQDAWQALATCSPPRRIPSRPPKRVQSAQNLFDEALVFLTHPDLEFAKRSKKRGKRRPVDVGTALTVPEATALLARFVFVADRARSEVRARTQVLLHELRSRMTAEVLQTWLLGHFFEVAQVSGTIHPMRLAAALPLVESILQLDPDLDRLIERILAAEPALTHSGRLHRRSWRDAQPDVATVIDQLAVTDRGELLVLTGEAGIGKSTVLEGIFRELKSRGEQAVWLSLGYEAGPPPNADQLAGMKRVFGQRSAWSGQPFWMFVDGIDGVPDHIHFLKPVEKLRVIVAARTETYEPRRQFAAREVRLERWPRAEVTDAFKADLPDELATLLGNPFLLNLALEIHTGTVRRPTRFAVLSRFLADVVFERGSVGVSARACFDVMARGVVRGDVWTRPPADGLQKLVDHGVATAPGGGRARFTHPLFTEIAATIWAAHRDAVQCVRRLLRIRDSFLRASALRVLMEGCADVGDSARLLDLPELAALLTAGLEGDLDIVGGLASLDIVVPEVLQHRRSPDFCARLFEAAKLADQRSWLTAVGLLDVEPRPPWATADTLEDALLHIAHHLAACGTSLAPDLRRAVAVRLRAWSAGQQSLWVSYLVDVLAAELPDNDTLDWISSVMLETRHSVTAWLRGGVRRICSRGMELDPLRVRSLVGQLIDADRPHDLERYQDAYELLLAGKDDRGLLLTQPEIAIDLLLDWHDDETRRERELRRRWQEEFSDAKRSHDTEIGDG